MSSSCARPRTVVFMAAWPASTFFSTDLAADLKGVLSNYIFSLFKSLPSSETTKKYGFPKSFSKNDKRGVIIILCTMCHFIIFFFLFTRHCRKNNIQIWTRFEKVWDLWFTVSRDHVPNVERTVVPHTLCTEHRDVCNVDNYTRAAVWKS